jgi:nicotinamidase-related amidase
MLSQEELIARKKSRIQEIHRMDPKRTALLVIDMQCAFLDPAASLYVPTSAEIIPVIKELIACCRRIKVPVIFTKFISSPEIPSLRKDPFGPEHLPGTQGEPRGWGLPSGSCIDGETDAECPDIVDILQPQPGEAVIRSHALDKFYGTPLDMLLRARDIRYLMVTGLLADLCVAATVYSANAREYRVTAITDGITTIWPDILKAVYDIFERKLARLMSAEEAARELEEQV